MHKSFVYSILAASLCFAVFTAPTIASTNLVVNGSFEGSTSTVDGDNFPSGWTLGPPDANSDVNVSSIVSGTLAPQSGANYLRYQSPETDGSEDCVYQNIATTVGAHYTLSYYIADTASSKGYYSEFHAVWDENTSNAQTITYPIASVANQAGPVGYTLYSFDEIASTTSTRVDFHGVDSGGSILLDNVSVTATPEPAIVGVVAVCTLIGGLLRRNRVPEIAV